ncbi:uncharacterized protein LOC119277711 isoform X3 [Triticum dicoccoides]|uniref:uncharacterized protein LOC119277711 isoform X3 n=1 Tax=Triticum dicoccoides TaxID=85692 RepID=UPI00188F09DC|nr:uncharacterized protein LOC119277711 isoform X3 [Triticum dicoccoides]
MLEQEAGMNILLWKVERLRQRMILVGGSTWERCAELLKKRDSHHWPMHILRHEKHLKELLFPRDGSSSTTDGVACKLDVLIVLLALIGKGKHSTIWLCLGYVLPRPQDLLSPIYASRQHFISSCGFSPDQATSLTFRTSPADPSAIKEGSHQRRLRVPLWRECTCPGGFPSAAWVRRCLLQLGLLAGDLTITSPSAAADEDVRRIWP